MKKIFLLILIFSTGSRIQAQMNINFSAVADADDWQLFMSKKIIADLKTGTSRKMVFITFTAGDAGLGSGGAGAIPFYLAKERGAVRSSKFLDEITNQTYPNSSAIPAATTVVLNGKTLTKYDYVNGGGEVVNYFLRLPDGASNGAGFSGTGNNSLMKLKLGTITSLTSVDGVNTYTWAQLVNTIKYIIFAEKSTDPQVYLNTSDLSSITNPGDHSDHYYSSMAAHEAVSTYLWVGINAFVMDNSSNLIVNLTDQEHEQESALFGVYNFNLLRNRYANQLNGTTRPWLSRESFSVERIASGTAGVLPVTLLSFSGTLKGNNVLLEWSTTSELNSKEFEIERSNDGITYRRLNTVAAAGFSSSLKKYSYLDIEATELNYYRLKMVDQDGNSKQSDVVIVKNNSLLQSITVLNNPFSDHINIRFAKIPKGGVTLRLVDLTGKLISVSENYQPSLSSIVRFDINKNLSRGIYVLQVESEGKQYSIKLMTQ